MVGIVLGKIPTPTGDFPQSNAFGLSKAEVAYINDFLTRRVLGKFWKRGSRSASCFQMRFLRGGNSVGRRGRRLANDELRLDHDLSAMVILTGAADAFE